MFQTIYEELPSTQERQFNFNLSNINNHQQEDHHKQFDLKSLSSINSDNEEETINDIRYDTPTLFLQDRNFTEQNDADSDEKEGQEKSKTEKIFKGLGLLVRQKSVEELPSSSIPNLGREAKTQASKILNTILQQRTQINTELDDPFQNGGQNYPNQDKLQLYQEEEQHKRNVSPFVSVQVSNDDSKMVTLQIPNGLAKVMKPFLNFLSKEDSAPIKLALDHYLCASNPDSCLCSPAQRSILKNTVVDNRKYIGVGIVFERLKDGRYVVTSVMPQSPASSANILPYDEIVEVNGIPARNLTPVELQILLSKEWSPTVETDILVQAHRKAKEIKELGDIARLASSSRNPQALQTIAKVVTLHEESVTGTVKLSILRSSFSLPFSQESSKKWMDIVVQKGIVHLDTLFSFDLPDLGALYVNLPVFNPRNIDNVQKIIQNVFNGSDKDMHIRTLQDEQGRPYTKFQPMRVLIIDLRNSGFGEVSSAVDFVSMFLPLHTPVTQVLKKNTETNLYEAEEQITSTDRGLLINERSPTWISKRIKHELEWVLFLTNSNTSRCAEVAVSAIQHYEKHKNMLEREAVVIPPRSSEGLEKNVPKSQSEDPLKRYETTSDRVHVSISKKVKRDIRFLTLGDETTFGRANKTKFKIFEENSATSTASVNTLIRSNHSSYALADGTLINDHGVRPDIIIPRTGTEAMVSAASGISRLKRSLQEDQQFQKVVSIVDHLGTLRDENRELYSKGLQKDVISAIVS